MKVNNTWRKAVISFVCAATIRSTQGSSEHARADAELQGQSTTQQRTGLVLVVVLPVPHRLSNRSRTRAVACRCTTK